MNESGVIKDGYIYDTLVLLCSNNTGCKQPKSDRLNGFHDEMNDQRLKVSLITTKNWAMSGLDCHQFKDDTEGLSKI